MIFFYSPVEPVREDETVGGFVSPPDPHGPFPTDDQHCGQKMMRIIVPKKGQN